jgi:pentatricopeptide repeat protein
MLKEGFSPNSVTFIFILKACGTIGAIDNGKLVHDAIIHSGLLDKDIALGTALVDMHARCGMLVKALEVLEVIPVRNTVSWSALIGGYAQHGLVQKALSCFEWMQCEGFPPNDVTCLCLLNAFSQSGMVQEAQIIFDNMRKCYGITPNLEHHTCMMVALGYAGHFDRAVALIETMPCSDHVVLWLALLGACRKWGNQGLSRLAFDQILRLDSKCSAAYSLMSGIYADNGMRADAEKVEAMGVKHAACTKGGDSNVYVDNFSWL